MSSETPQKHTDQEEMTKILFSETNVCILTVNAAKLTIRIILHFSFLKYSRVKSTVKADLETDRCF